MARRPLLLVALALAAGCRLEPAGRCDTRADCSNGLGCLEGVCAACRGDFDCSAWEVCGEGLCAAAFGRCGSDADCVAWRECDASHECALRDGRCEVRADCAAGLDCLGDVCAACSAPADCADWELCGGDGLCAPDAGRCNTDGDCVSWEECDAGHACVPRTDHCPSLSCDPLERCDPEHHCTLQPGRCAVKADCFAWMASCDVPTNTCLFPAAAGDDVLAWGAVDERRTDRLAVARVTAPNAVEVGFDAYSALDGRGFVDPVTGEVVYRHPGDPGGDTLRRFNRDATVPSPLTASWLYPADPSADDERAIDTSACPTTWGPWLMQGATGALLYGCPAAGTKWSLHLDGGATIFAAIETPLAWSPNGYLLALDGAGAPRILDGGGGGGALAIAGLHAGTILAQRTTGAGFLVALRCASDGVDELWAIADGARSATLTDTYPATVEYAAWEIMDSEGTLYGRTFVGSNDVVLKLSLTAGTSKIYDEELDAPILQLPPGSFLFTRP